MRGRIGIVRIGGERGIHTESSRGAEVGSVNGIVVRENIGAVNASCLDRMIRLCVEHCVYFVPIHFFFLFPKSMYLNSQKDCTRPRREKKRNNL